MFIWWYTVGLKGQFEAGKKRFLSLSDSFSIGLLVKTWFKPFRQIGTGGGGPSLEAKLRAFIDRLVSRLVGGVIRTVVMIVGIFALAFSLLLNTLRLALWVALPALPFASVALVGIFGVPDLSVLEVLWKK